MYKFSDFLDWEKIEPEEAFHVSNEFYKKLAGVLTDTPSLHHSNQREMYKELLTRIDNNLEVNSVNEVAFVMYIVSETISIYKELLKNYSGLEKHDAFLEIIKAVYTNIE